jgi:hypothetical protein
MKLFRLVERMMQGYAVEPWPPRYPYTSKFLHATYTKSTKCTPFPLQLILLLQNCYSEIFDTVFVIVIVLFGTGIAQYSIFCSSKSSAKISNDFCYTSTSSYAFMT